MIVDNDEEFCELITTYFLDREFDVEAVGDGNIALKTMTEQKPDIVILDIYLGDNSIDGWELCTYITNEDRYINRQMGIILISGKFRKPEQQTKGLELGAHHYLIRPFEPKDLLARVNSLGPLLNIAEPAIDSINLANGLSINFPRHEVTVLDKLIDLNQPEFDVLALLASDPGVYFTNQQIIDAVWPFDPEKPDEVTSPNTVLTVIHKLRKKLDAENTKRFIDTLRKKGYKLNDRGPVA